MLHCSQGAWIYNLIDRHKQHFQTYSTSSCKYWRTHHVEPLQSKGHQWKQCVSIALKGLGQLCYELYEMNWELKLRNHRDFLGTCQRSRLPKSPATSFQSRNNSCNAKKAASMNWYIIANVSVKVHDTQTPALKLYRVEKCVCLNSDVLQKHQPSSKQTKFQDGEGRWTWSSS